MLRNLLLVVFVFLFPLSVFAKYDPRTVPNNKYGIHVADVNDISDTAALVNSSGGDWGYVTLVLQDNDQNLGKWQNIFNQMRRLHLIPILRLATHLEKNYWTKPQAVDAGARVAFLNDLNWPIENRYVVLFNEPNHAKEWGGEVSPEGYAEIFVAYAEALERSSEDFFILPAGLDASAPNSADTMDAGEFIRRMLAAEPQMLDLMDGWTSHSYPNPGFSGSPYAFGKGTIRSYLWELGELPKNLPVFITETGWLNTVPNNVQIAASTVWQDPRIIAITPFVFNYQSAPFEQFSWKKRRGSDFYPHYFAYQGIPKTMGTPKQRHAFSMEKPLLPDVLVASSNYTLRGTVKNAGQAIVGEKEGYTLSLTGFTGDFEIILDSIPSFEPGEIVSIETKLHTPAAPGEYQLTLSVTRGSERYPVEEKRVTLVPPPALSLTLALGWRRKGDARDVTVLVYDKDQLIHKFTGLTVTDGHAQVAGLTDVIPGNRYRVVTLVPYYLPRQAERVLGSDVTDVTLKRFLPLDPNRDGAFTLADIIAFWKSKPHDVLPRFFGP